MERLEEILKEVMPDCDDVLGTKDYIKEGYLTSFTLTQLVVSLNDEFDIEITPVDLVPENFKNYDSIKSLIEKLED